MNLALAILLAGYAAYAVAINQPWPALALAFSAGGLFTAWMNRSRRGGRS